MRQQRIFRTAIGIVLAALVVGLFSFLSAAVASHGDEAANGGMLDESVRQNSLAAVALGAVLVLALIVASAFVKGKRKRVNPLVLHLLFWPIVIAVVVVTAYVAGSTIYLNLISATNGPVHWHADFEVWNCGQAVDLVDPRGLSNKAGTAVMHEHGDNRMHVEGVIVDYSDVRLGRLWEAVGGDLHRGWFALPTNAGRITMKDGDACGDGNGKLQIFVYKAVDGKVVQEKLDPASYEYYVLSPYGQVPPGDCIIFEFDSEVKEKTERVCESYEVAIERGALNGG